MATARYKCLEQKPLKVPFFICGATESLLENISACDNNPQESYTTKITIQCGATHYSQIVYLIAKKPPKNKQTNKQTWFLVMTL